MPCFQLLSELSTVQKPESACKRGPKAPFEPTGHGRRALAGPRARRPDRARTQHNGVLYDCAESCTADPSRERQRPVKTPRPRDGRPDCGRTIVHGHLALPNWPIVSYLLVSQGVRAPNRTRRPPVATARRGRVLSWSATVHPPNRGARSRRCRYRRCVGTRPSPG